MTGFIGHPLCDLPLGEGEKLLPLLFQGRTEEGLFPEPRHQGIDPMEHQRWIMAA